PVSAEVPRFVPSRYALDRKPQGHVGASDVESGGDEMLLLDARAPARYRGEQEPIDPVAGRIPGARNRFNMDNVSAQGTFKGAEQLRQEFRAVLGDRSPSEVVHYCGSGVAACHN